MPPMDHLTKYLNAERGRRVQLAAMLGISPAAISMWTIVPSERVVDVERHTGIPRQKLRPDLYEGMTKGK